MNTDKRSKLRIRNLLAVIGLTLLLIAGQGGSVSAGADQAPAVEMHDESGVLIVSVLADSPASSAGLSRGNIVLAVDEKPVDDAESLAQLIGDLAPGDEVALTVLHGDDILELSAILGERNGRTFLGVVPYVEDDPDAGMTDMKPDDADIEEPSASEEEDADSTEADAMSENDDANGKAGKDEGSTSPRTFLRGMMPLFAQGGALISRVVEDGPAAEAGLVAGDLIVAVDDQALGEEADLGDLIATYVPGDEVILTVHNIESNEKLEVPVTLGAHPDESKRAFLGVAYLPVPALPDMGDILPEADAYLDENDLPVEPLPDRLMTPNGEGVMIVDVVSGSPADEAGLLIGDLIVAVDGEALTAEVDLAKLIGSFAPGDEIVLTIHNAEANETMEVPITLGAHPEDEDRAFVGIAYAIAPLLGSQEEADPENDAKEEDATEGSETDMDGSDEEAGAENNAEGDVVGDVEGNLAGEEADTSNTEGGDDEGNVAPRRQTRMGHGGAMVADVVDGGPADQAGLTEGDVIVALDGEKLTADASLGDRIASYEPGDEVTLTVYSRQSRETVDVLATLDMHPEDESKAFLGVAYVSLPEWTPGSRYQRGPAPVVPRQGQEPQEKDGCFHRYSPEGHEGHHGRFHGEGYQGHPDGPCHEHHAAAKRTQ
jgi:S1-C subfamily serine protease